MPPKRRDTPKAAFWRKHLLEWKNSGLAQNEYCMRHDISKTAFSKWKARLYPAWKGKRKSYKPKSNYIKFTKLTDTQIEVMIRSFVVGSPAKVAAERVGVSERSIHHYYKKLRLAHLDSALLYPHLYSGAGVLLLLGPPYDIRERMKIANSYFAGIKGNTSRNSINNQTLANNIKVIYRMLLFNSLFEWTEAEIYLFRENAYKIFYREFYSTHYKMDSNAWNIKIYNKIDLEVPATTIAKTLWNHWARTRKKSYLSKELWDAMFYKRPFLKDINKWINSMERDLKWAIKNRNLNTKSKFRNQYWDEYVPSRNAMNEASEAIYLKILELKELEES